MSVEKPKIVNLTIREKGFYDAGKAQGYVDALKMAKGHITKVANALKARVQPIGFTTASTIFLKTLKTKKADISWLSVLDQISEQFDIPMRVKGEEGNKKLIAALEDASKSQKKERKDKKRKKK